MRRLLGQIGRGVVELLCLAYILVNHILFLDADDFFVQFFYGG